MCSGRHLYGGANIGPLCSKNVHFGFEGLEPLEIEAKFLLKVYGVIYKVYVPYTGMILFTHSFFAKSEILVCETMERITTAL